LVLGLGNPILTDDGIGIHVARAVAGRTHLGDAPLDEGVELGAGHAVEAAVAGDPEVARAVLQDHLHQSVPQAVAGADGADAAVA